MKSFKVLLVEDEANLAPGMKKQFEAWGFSAIEVVPDRHRALDSIRTHLPSLAVIQVQLRESWQTVEMGLLISSLPGTPIIFIGSENETADENRWLLLMVNQEAYPTVAYSEESLRAAVAKALNVSLPARQSPQ